MPTFRATPEQIAALLANAAAVTITEAKPLDLAGPDDDEAKTEKEFQAQVNKEFRTFGWKPYHTHNSRKSAAGFPDLCAGRIGLVVVAELKVGDNAPTAEQVEWLNFWKSAGVPTYLWYPKDWADIAAVARSTLGPCPFAKQWEVTAGSE